MQKIFSPSNARRTAIRRAGSKARRFSRRPSPTSLPYTSAREPSWPEEAITPEQFFVPAQESLARWTGERRLLLAVLQDAVRSFMKYHRVRTIRGERLFREVQEWFWSKEQQRLYSFERICQHLQMDPEAIRQALQRRFLSPRRASLSRQ